MDESTTKGGRRRSMRRWEEDNLRSSTYSDGIASGMGFSGSTRCDQRGQKRRVKPPNYARALRLMTRQAARKRGFWLGYNAALFFFIYLFGCAALLGVGNGGEGGTHRPVRYEQMASGQELDGQSWDKSRKGQRMCPKRSTYIHTYIPLWRRQRAINTEWIRIRWVIYLKENC